MYSLPRQLIAALVIARLPFTAGATLAPDGQSASPPPAPSGRLGGRPVTG